MIRPVFTKDYYCNTVKDGLEVIKIKVEKQEDNAAAEDRNWESSEGVGSNADSLVGSESTFEVGHQQYFCHDLTFIEPQKILRP